MTTDDGKHAPTAAELREFVCSVEGGPVPTTFPAHVYWKAIEARLNSHATLLRERDELRRALPRAREAAAYAAWLDIFERFSDSQRKQLANLFAHDWTVAAVEIQSYHGEAPTRIEAPVPISVALATKKARLAALTASADKADSKSGGG